MDGRDRPGRPRRLARRMTIGSGSALVLVVGMLALMHVFHLEIMINSGVVIAISPWTHDVVVCSVKGCYAMSPT